MDRVFLVAVDVNDGCIDLEEPIVARDAKLENDLTTFRRQVVCRHIDSRDRKVDQESGFLLSAVYKNAAADKGYSE